MGAKIINQSPFFFLYTHVANTKKQKKYKEKNIK